MEALSVSAWDAKLSISINSASLADLSVKVVNLSSVAVASASQDFCVRAVVKLREYSSASSTALCASALS